MKNVFVALAISLGLMKEKQPEPERKPRKQAEHPVKLKPVQKFQRPKHQRRKRK
ncbi:hypothetical protein [Neisseria shayeganii]|uniref:Uncharacterized protein n=1 Tax=Neisseria shayeganii 871 TaxID=1032488 RepID=G4CG55_9NEIS|nr:hypothetical protein [Neisseria shayeganii]EGY53103.1 hypothetical protein HMPREF9371_0594 [Neisseria shayeganii 871]